MHSLHRLTNILTYRQTNWTDPKNTAESNDMTSEAQIISILVSLACNNSPIPSSSEQRQQAFVEGKKTKTEIDSEYEYGKG